MIVTLSVYDGGGGIELSKANNILDRYNTWDPEEALIPALQEVMRDFGQVPAWVAALISERFAIPLPQIYGVATFYNDFKVLERAEHKLMFCEGTACYLCGNKPLYEAAKEKLGIDYNEITPDKKWELARANFCFGACQLAPMVEVDHTFYGHMNPEKLNILIDQVSKKEGH
jgi:NADH-quinone oxidoreductase subunit E